MNEMLGKYKLKEQFKVSISKSISLQEHEVNFKDKRIEKGVNKNCVVKLPKESGDSEKRAMKPQTKKPRIGIEKECIQSSAKNILRLLESYYDENSHKRFIERIQRIIRIGIRNKEITQIFLQNE